MKLSTKGRTNFSIEQRLYTWSSMFTVIFYDGFTGAVFISPEI